MAKKTKKAVKKVSKKQVAFSFDAESLKKIVKGALIAMTGAAAIAGLDYIGTIQIGNPIWTAIVAWGVPTAVNAIKEFVQGAKS